MYVIEHLKTFKKRELTFKGIIISLSSNGV
jgi:hypothetical protein